MSWLLVGYGRSGPARYISHLDTMRALQRVFARAGVAIALSQGMRPKPRLSIPLPLPVGAAAAGELALVEVDGEWGGPRLSNVLPALRAATAGGLDVESLTLAQQRPRPLARAATYRCRVTGAEVDVISTAAQAMRDAGTLPLERVTARGVKRLDLASYLENITVAAEGDDAVLTFAVKVRDEGSARPAEVVAELGRHASAALQQRSLERVAVRFDGIPDGWGADKGFDGSPAGARDKE